MKIPRYAGAIVVLALFAWILGACTIHDYRTKNYVADSDERGSQVGDVAMSVNIVASDTVRTRTKSYQGPPYRIGVGTRMPTERRQSIVISALSVVGPDGAREVCLPDGRPLTIGANGGQVHKGIRRKYWTSAQLSFGFEKNKSITVEIETEIDGKYLKKSIRFKATETRRRSTLKNAFDAV